MRTPACRFAGPGTRNGCAQAAVGTLLDFWQLSEPPLDVIYRVFPPDTPFGLLGTSPSRLAAACRAHGLLAAAHAHRDAAEARTFLMGELAAGRPVVVLLDLRHLGRRLPAGHYVVAYRADEDAVEVANMVACGSLPKGHARVPWKPFFAGWRCGAMPLRAWRYAAVTARPQPGAPAAG